MDIVINTSVGGFELSMKAQKRIAKLDSNIELYFYKLLANGDYVKVYEDDDDNCISYPLIKDFGDIISNYDYYKDVHNYIYHCVGYSYIDSDRCNPNLVKAVKELGEDANGNGAKLKIIAIPDDIEWEIVENHGVEYIREKSRCWY